MNLDDLKNRLAAQDARLDQLVRLNVARIRELQLSRTISGLRLLTSKIALELVVAVVAVVWLGDFIVGHLREPRFLVPAVLIDVCAIAFLGACIRQLSLVATLNYSLAVVVVQKSLARLRILRIRTNWWTMTLSFVLWFPLLIVLFEGLLGVDLWQVLLMIGDRDRFMEWLVGNVLFGLTAALVMIWISSRYADRTNHSPAIHRLMDLFADRSLTKAQTSLDSIVQFESEPQAGG